MKNIIILFVIFSALRLPAQSISRQVISNGGNTSSDSSYTLCWTLGEANILTIQNSQILTQGFQQPDDSLHTPGSSGNTGSFNTGGTGYSFTYNNTGQLVNQSVVGSVATPVNITPSANQSICMGVSTVLSVSTPNGAIVNWYDQATNGNLLASGNSYTTPAISVPTNYYVEAVVNGCVSSRTVISINVNSCLATGNISPLIYCIGSSLTIPFTTAGAMNPVNTFTAQLSDASGSFANPIVLGTLAGTSSGTIVGQIPTNAPAGTGYRVRVVSSSPASVGLDNGADITINASTISPTITATQGTVCVGGAVSFTNSLTGTSGTVTRQWQVATNNGTFTNIAGATSTSYGITQNTANTYTYRLMVSKSGQCAGYSNVKTLVVTPDPSVTATGAAAYCVSGVATLTATPQYGAGTNTLTWERYSSSTATWATVGTNINPYTANVTASTTYRAKLSSTGTGCGVAYSPQVNITINPLPSVNTNPATSSTICIGGSRTISASGANSYSWYPSTGLNTTTGATVIATPTTTTTYSVIGTNNTTGCSKTVNITVNVVPDPTATITGPTTVCSGATAALSVGITGGTGNYTYAWQTSTNGTSFSNLSGTNSSTYTTPALTINRYYRAYITCNGTGCTTPFYSSVYQVNVVPMPQLVLSGTSPICSGGASTLTATLTGGTGTCPFSWEKSTDGGLTWASATAITTNTYSLSNQVSGAKYRVSVNCSGLGCGSVTSNVFDLVVNPDPTATVTGNGSYCGSGSSVLGVLLSGGAGTTTYQWQEYLSGAYTDISGATASTYTTPVLTASKNYRVLATYSGSGCNVAASPAVAVGILALPTTNLSSTTPSLVEMCEGGTRTIGITGNAVSYSWYPSTGLSTTTGTSAVLTPANIGTYVHTIYGIASNGCVKSVSTTTNVLPDPVVSITGPSNVPLNIGAQLTANWTGGAGVFTLKWQWRSSPTAAWADISSSSSTVTGLTNANYTTPTFTGTKYFRAALLTNGSGCGGTGTTAAWVYSTELGIISQTPPPRELQASNIMLYPNPAQDEIQLQISSNQTGKLQFEIHNQLGQLIAKWEGQLTDGLYEKSIDLSQYAEGMYFLQVKYPDLSSEVYKFVKE